MNATMPDFPSQVTAPVSVNAHRWTRTERTPTFSRRLLPAAAHVVRLLKLFSGAGLLLGSLLLDPSQSFGQGAITSGETLAGTISVTGENDSWTFTATA